MVGQPWGCRADQGELVTVTSHPDTRAVETWRDERAGKTRVVRGASMQLDNPVLYHVKLYWCGV